MLYSCRWKGMWLFSTELGQTLVSFTDSNIQIKLSWNKEPAISSVRWHCDEIEMRSRSSQSRHSQNSWFGKAWDSQSGVHKYLHTLWNSLLPRHSRMSDLTPQTPTPFLPPSAEMVWVLLWAVLLCWRQSRLYYLESLCAVRLPSFNQYYWVDWWCCFRRQ